MIDPVWYTNGKDDVTRISAINNYEREGIEMVVFERRMHGKIINNYSLKSRWIMAEYLPSREVVYTHEVISTTFSEGNH